MNSHFHFKGFSPTAELMFLARSSLDKALDKAPYATSAVALIEKEKDGFRCSLDVYSRYGPFLTSALDPTAIGAITEIRRKFERQIERWNSQKASSDQGQFF